MSNIHFNELSYSDFLDKPEVYTSSLKLQIEDIFKLTVSEAYQMSSLFEALAEELSKQGQQPQMIVKGRFSKQI